MCAVASRGSRAGWKPGARASKGSAGLVDVRVTVFAADARDHDQFDLVVAPQLVEIFGGLETTGPTSAREYLNETLSSYEIRFSVRVEAPHARAAATMTKERIQQTMREAGIRGVVSVPDGWPVA